MGGRLDEPLDVDFAGWADGRYIVIAFLHTDTFFSEKLHRGFSLVEGIRSKPFTLSFSGAYDNVMAW